MAIRAPDPPTIEELQELMDGRLQGPRLEEVYAWLARDREMAEMVQQMRRTDQALRRLGRAELSRAPVAEDTALPTDETPPASRFNGPDQPEPDLSRLLVPIDRDRFFRRMLRELTEAVEAVVGTSEMRRLVSVVGAKIGDEFHMLYREHLAQRCLTRPQVAAACCDLKRRIGGDFSVVQQDDSKIVFENRACPFGSQVLGRPSLCMMTSNVFGRLAAENLGYAKVTLEKTIANGDGGCRVILDLDQDADTDPNCGREYFQIDESSK